MPRLVFILVIKPLLASQSLSSEWVENLREHSSSITCIEKIPSANTKFAFGSNDGEIRHLKLDISESDDPKLIIGDQVVENSPNKSGITQILFGDFDGDGDIELGILRQDNCIQVWQLIQNQPLLRYASKQSDNFGNITGLFPLKGMDSSTGPLIFSCSVIHGSCESMIKRRIGTIY